MLDIDHLAVLAGVGLIIVVATGDWGGVDGSEEEDGGEGSESETHFEGAGRFERRWLGNERLSCLLRFCGWMNAPNGRS